jgi:hypothetical protein
MKIFTKKFFKDVASLLTVASTFFSVIGGFFSMRLAPMFFIVLLILKAVGVNYIQWFGWPKTLAVFTTPIWMVLFGFGLVVLGATIISIYEYIFENKNKGESHGTDIQ